MYKRKKLMVGILSLIMVCTAVAPMTATVNAATKTKAPAKVTVTSFKRTGSTKATVKWKKLKKHVSGYAVYTKVGSSKWRLTKKVGKNTCTVSFGTNPESKYQVKVRAYKNGKKVKKYYNKKAKKYVSKKAYKKLKKKNRTTKKVTSVKWGKYSSVRTANAVKENSGENSNNNSTNKPNSTKTQYKAKYSYKMGNSPIKGKYKYTNRSAIIHVKSNNPNNEIGRIPNVKIFIRSKEGHLYDGTQSNKKGEIRNDSGALHEWNSNIQSMAQLGHAGGVEDGFAQDVAGPQGSVDAGTYKVFVREYKECTDSTLDAEYFYWEEDDNPSKYEDIEIGTINILDYESERNIYFKNIMESITTDEMTKDEKMTAVEKWIFNNYRYSGSGIGGYEMDRDIPLLDLKKGDEVYLLYSMQSLAVPFESRYVTCIGIANLIKDFGDVIDYSIEIVHVPDHYYAVHKNKSGKIERDFDFSVPPAKDRVTTDSDFINWSQL